MKIDEIEILDNHFELSDDKEEYSSMINISQNNDREYSGINIVPIMDEYPNPNNTFDIFSNVQDDGGRGVSGQDVAGAIEGVGAIVSAFKKTGLKKTIKDTCGRRPILKKKRNSSGWNNCEQRVKSIANGIRNYSDDKKTQGYQDNNLPQIPPQPKGLSTGAKVGIGIGVALMLTGVVILIYKRRN